MVGRRVPIVVVLGTRPDLIKLAPVVRLLRGVDQWCLTVVSTGQHRDMLAQLLPVMRVDVDHCLSVMRERQSLADLTARLFTSLAELMATARPAALMVQGDTTTAMCAALCAFYAGIPVAHVEAGLRSDHISDPFPEELNRRIVGQVARWHFAPTAIAAANLRAEGVRAEQVEVTGNTVIDSLHWMLRQHIGRVAFSSTRPKALVTLHRRENQGATMRLLADAVARLAGAGVEVVLPVHHNPAVRDVLVPRLSGASGVVMTEPLSYPDFVATLNACDLVLTDSGGVQEEATSLGKQILVLRRTTERPEAVRSGLAQLVGVDPDVVYDRAMRFLSAPRMRPSRGRDVFGDGKAALRIVERLEADLLGRSHP
jgi:UDP-N-acetylglucosamine 2-epimerase (non-hydrolysing)